MTDGSWTAEQRDMIMGGLTEKPRMQRAPIGDTPWPGDAKANVAYQQMGRAVGGDYGVGPAPPEPVSVSDHLGRAESSTFRATLTALRIRDLVSGADTSKGEVANDGACLMSRVADLATAAGYLEAMLSEIEGQLRG